MEKKNSCSRAELTRIALLWGLAFLIAAAGFSRTDDTNALARVDALARDVMEVARLPSLSLAILEPDSTTGELVIAYRRALGYADIEAKTRATPDTRYRAASVSKVIAATALARLVAQGTIDWDTELNTLIPVFPQSEGITPRRLAGHLAGIGHYQGQDKIDRQRQYKTAMEALETFRSSPRAGKPGEQYKYSTHGLTLLSAMLEVAAGVSFPEIVAATVAQPLGMTSTGPAPAGQGKDGMATLYMLLRAGPKPVPRPENPSYKWAGGGLASTPTDLVRLARGYLAGDLAEGDGERSFLPKEVRDTLWTPQQVGSESTGVGIAWRIGQEGSQGRTIVHHAGSMQGARSVLMLFPQERRAIAVMTNSNWDSDIERTAAVLMEAWRGDPESGAGVLKTPAGPVRYSVQLVARPGDGGNGGPSSEDEEAFDAVKGVARVPKQWSKIALPAPPGFRNVSRAPVPALRAAWVNGDVWCLATPRGLARGTCSLDEASSGVACRFEVARKYDLLVDFVPEGTP